MIADQKTQAEVMAVLDKLSEAYAKRDLSMFESLFSTDPDVFFFGTGADEKRQGLDEIKAQAERDWSQSESTFLEWGPHLISSSDSVAWVETDATIHARIEGQDMTMPGRMTVVLQKRGDKWFIAQAHFSMPLAEQAAGESFPS